MQHPDRYTFLWLLILSVFCSCSGLKHLPKGEQLYTGGKVKFDPKVHKQKKLRKELEGLLRPKPNTSILGMRPKLFLYNISKKPKGKGLNYLLHEKWGEPPVLFSSVNLQKNADVLANHLENNGFFQATVNGDSTAYAKGRAVKAVYTVNAGHRYTINKVFFPGDSSALHTTDSSSLNREIRTTEKETLLKPDDYFDLDVIKAERERIDTRLKNEGYFYFNPDYLIMDVDSTLDGKVNIYVRVKPEAPEKALKTYAINDISVYTNYSLTRDSMVRSQPGFLYDDYRIVDPRHRFKPVIFRRSIFFRKGKLYTRKDHNLSLNRLVNLNVFQFVKLEFADVDSAAAITDTLQPDEGLLNANFYLTPAKKRSLRFQLSGYSKSNNFVGSEIQISARNRNWLKGAEMLELNLAGGFETQVGGKQQLATNSYSLSADGNLYIPRFITPFRGINGGSTYVPKTVLNIGYELLNKEKFYTLNSFRLQGGYNWKESEIKNHVLNVVSVSYVLPTHITDTFRTQLDLDPVLRQSFQKQFIIGSNYSYTYDDQILTEKRHNTYLNGTVDIAGNLLGLFYGSHDAEHPAELFNTPFSQYIRLSADARNYWKLGDGLKWVNRIFVGYGYAYGNSLSLPFVKQFYIGGSNSIRAFRARTLGPGTYHSEKTAIFASEAGDIKLEMNTELRAKLFSVVNGALFVDAGNIWLEHTNPQQPGGRFRFNKMFSELAVGAGAGLRFDFSIFVLRLDLAFPLRKPYLPEGQRWVINDIDFGSSQWRKENLILNIAIGYPF